MKPLKGKRRRWTTVAAAALASALMLAPGAASVQCRLPARPLGPTTPKPLGCVGLLPGPEREGTFIPSAILAGTFRAFRGLEGTSVPSRCS